MAQPKTQPPMYRLPPELLLQIAGHLRAKSPSHLTHLRNLCLVSKKLLPIAQEQLYAHAQLPTACGCHPTVNAALQLLRTLLERPALAQHVKALRFSVVRRNVGKLYQEELSKKNLDLPALRKVCMDQLAKLGYGEDHPWSASLRNNLESAFAGLLLCILPNLAKLQYCIRELPRGCAVVDANSALFGACSPPSTLAATMGMVLRELCTSELTFLRSMAFEQLNVLKIQSVSVQTLLQLNGPNTFRGTARLSQLCVGLSVFLMDRDCINDMQIGFPDLINALGCHELSTLRIKLEHESYCVLHNPILDVQLLMDQISSLGVTLKVLEIDLDPKDDVAEWEFILTHCKNMTLPMLHFTKMEALRIPQAFLFADLDSETKIMPRDLPRKLRQLQIVAPDEDINSWARRILDLTHDLEQLREITLCCRDLVNSSASTFSKKVKPVWPDLLLCSNITSYVVNVETNKFDSLPSLYEHDPGESDDEVDEWEEEIDDEDDEDMPDLEPYEPLSDAGIINSGDLVVDNMG